MRFRGLDLNALVALNTLFEERNVTAAARRLFLSQSATSGVLATLRRHFNDPLLERAGRSLILTAFGQSLVEPLRETMRHIEVIAGASAKFEPATSHRSFSVVASDYVIALVAPVLIPALRREAPGVRLLLAHPSDAPEVLLNQGDVDLVVTPDSFVSMPHHREPFYEEDHVVLGWAANPLLAGAIGPDDLLQASQVVVRFGLTGQRTFAEQELTRAGHPPRVAAVAASFTSVPAMLVETDLISVVHRRIARRALEAQPLTMRELPVPIPAMRQTLLFHALRQHDQGLLWLRTKLRDGIVAADAAASAPPPRGRR